MGTSRNDALSGDAGDDIVDGGAGNDTLNGGVGDHDTARFWDVRANYTITENADGSWQVVHTGFNPVNALGRFSDGIDTLFNIEQAQFADQIFSLINDAPVAVADSATTSENTPVNINVLANDTDLDGDALSVTQIDGQAVTSSQTVTLAGGAQATLNGNGTITYAPAVSANGAVSFGYTVSDGKGGTASADVGVTIAPVATPASIAFGSSTGVTSLVSVSSAGEQGNTYSYPGSISADGRYVTFWSQATNLVAGDTNGTLDVFVRDLRPGFSGTEDGAAISLPITVTSAAGETVAAVILSGLPSGSVLSDGISSNGGTTWTFAGAPPANLTLTPPANYNGSFTLTVTATTLDGASTATATATQTVTISPFNDAPFVTNALADQSATEDAAFSFTVPANTFTDVDGDALTYAATLANGAPLPTWLSFNPTTRTFSGTPLNGDVGTLSVKVSATDQGGLAGGDVFNLAIAAETIAPTAIVTDDVAGVATGNVTYQIAFSEAVTGLAADDFTVTNGSVVSVSGSGQSYSVTVAPAAGFEGSLALSLNAAAVRDKSGNANAAVSADAQLVDTRKPVLTTITPAADSTGVLVAANISLTYSEAVRAGAGIIELRTAAGTLVESFNVATSNRLAFAGSTITIDPTALLGGATQYRLTVPEGAVLDHADRPCSKGFCPIWSVSVPSFSSGNCSPACSESHDCQDRSMC